MSIVPLSPTDRCRSYNIPGPKVGVKDVAKQTSHQEYVLRYAASDAYNAKVAKVEDLRRHVARLG